MKAYKASYNGFCHGFEFKVGKTYTYNKDIRIGQSGFHFCQKAIDTLKYYIFDENFVLFEIEAIPIITEYDTSVTNKITILREIPKEEYWELLKIKVKGNKTYREWADGTKAWYLNDHLHREDGPAYEGADGTKEWYLNDQRHREDGPAIEKADGTKQWCLNDQLHREDGPAIEWADGAKEWWLNGQLHREDGPACEEADGTKYWFLNDKFHREDGPACEYASGSKVWYLNGQCHREDGPACEYADGTKYWYLNGKNLTEEEFNRRTKK